ncbi:MAG TPA: ATP-dependent RNA helicase HrpA [Phycisphaerales bacterium]|nr:ATP-dependent RNA helicase HrpA [Phycisphaerales bacterium]
MKQELATLRARIELCLGRDRQRLRRALDHVRRYRKAPERARPILARIAQQVEASIALRKKRFESRPAVSFPQELPVTQRREEISAAIAEHQVVVVCGETGSGKSTQLPKICLELGRGLDGLIGHTQPRRIAARALAGRLSEELHAPLGDVVGYKVRFDQAIKPTAFVKLMTDGILLAELQSDPLLRNYDTIILDEAHERTVNIDFLLGCIHRILPKRPELKLIITSATIDPQRFSEHFHNCPIIEVSGRTFPVEIRYQSVEDSSATEDLSAMQSSIVTAVDELLSIPVKAEGNRARDILVFLPGEREIRDASRALRTFASKGVEILPLYARLSAKEQQRVFAEHTRTRIILATNVAETSLTVPGVRYVIDTGLARISRYNSRTKFLRLHIEAISQASANQRAGRCGRTADGVCIRLYSEEDFNEREAFTQPELQRTNLAAVILQMLASNMGDIATFPFIDRPRAAHIRDAFDTLAELGAIDAHHQLTQTGRQLARLPIDPRLGKMLMTAQKEGSLRQALVLAAALSIQDPRDRPLAAQEAADSAHRVFRDGTSDLLTLLNIWHVFSAQSRLLSQNQLRKWCGQHFLSWNRMNEWRDLHHQLAGLMHELRIHVPPGPEESEAQPGALAPQLQDAIHRAILSGLLSNIAVKDEGHAYLGANRTQCFLFPGSVLFNQQPRWVMAAELVETTKLYLRNAAPIKPEWAEEFGMHLVTRTHVDPHWDPHGGRVMAFERVLLFGLELISKRRVHYGPINPAVSRELFIQHALVNGDYRTGTQFLQHNRRLVEEIQNMEDRARKHDLLIDPEQRFIFYDAMLPQDVYTGRHFEKWASHLSPEQAARMRMTREMLLKPERSAADAGAFPDAISISSGKNLAESAAGEGIESATSDAGTLIGKSSDGLSLPLTYRHAPGEADDGISISLPVELLPMLSPTRLDHLVPGMLREKITALLRGLPKETRQQISPLSEFVDHLLQAPLNANQALTRFIGEHLRKRFGILVPAEQWAAVELPAHLLMNVRLLNAEGKLVAQSRSLAQLNTIAKAYLENAAPITDARFPARTTARWDFGDLPEAFSIIRGKIPIVVHPVIADQGDSVRLSLEVSCRRAEDMNREGIRRLFAIASGDELDAYLRDLPDLDLMCLDYSTLGSARQLQDHLRLLIAERTFMDAGEEIPKTQREFEARIDARWSKLWEMTGAVIAFVAPMLRTYQHIHLALVQTQFKSLSIEDMKHHLTRLIPADVLVSTPRGWLEHLPRYLHALSIRLKRLMPSAAGKTSSFPERTAGSAAPFAKLKAHVKSANPSRTGAGKEFAKDEKILDELIPLERSVFARLDSVSGDVPDSELVRLRWMLEELRVAVFAQELSTIQPVSIKRMQRALDELSA